MVDRFKLNKLCKAVINGKTLTIDILMDVCGLSPDDVRGLIIDGVLNHSNGIYIFNGFDEMKEYSRILQHLKDYKNSVLALKVCYELNPNDIEVSVKLFNHSIFTSNYEEAYKYLKSLKGTHEYNLYLFLLSYLTKLDEEDVNYVKAFSFIDILKYCDGIDTQSVSTLIDMLEKTFVGAFKASKHYLNILFKEDTTNEYEFLILKHILNIVIDRTNSEEQIILDLLNIKKFDKALEFLEEISSRRKLCSYEEYVYRLLKVINGKDQIPVIEGDNQYFNVYDAIDNQDYAKALEISDNYLINFNLDRNKNILNMLLREICPMKDSMEHFTRFCNDLTKNDLKKSLVSLKGLLCFLGEEKYYSLVVNLIKISISEGDIGYILPMSTLMNIKNGTFVFDKDFYISKYHEAMKANAIIEAECYLDIISKYVGEDVSLSLSEVYSPKHIVFNDDFDEELVKNINSELSLEEPLVLLPSIDFKSIDRTLFIVKSYPNMLAFKVDFNGEVYIAFQYHIKAKDRKEYVDYKKLISEARNFENEQKYKNALELQKKLIVNSNECKSLNFVKIGLLYIKLGKKMEAVPYLKVATYLSKVEGRTEDYSSLIQDLLKNEDYKPIGTLVEDDEFRNGEKEKYNNVLHQEIVQRIIKGEVSLSDVTDLTEIGKLIVMLLLAKEYYKMGNKKLGDKYLKIVARSDDKNEDVVLLMRDIEVNKKLYRIQHKKIGE